MPQITLTIFDPIEIIIGDQKFAIERISSNLLESLQSTVGDIGADPANIKGDMLANLLVKAIPGMTKEVAMEIDIRHIPVIINFLAEQITSSIEPPKAGEGKNG